VWQRPARLLATVARHLLMTGAGLGVMTRKEFRRLVTEVLETLPAELASRIENVEVVVEDEPTDEQIRGAGLDPREDTLFGLYEGVPLDARGHDYAALPDKISIFYLPIVETCTSTAEIRDEIRTTVLHEVAHFFGIDDEDLDEWGY
jgi:predicted Zn-dependent protease with MMP-like domain